MYSRRQRTTKCPVDAQADPYRASLPCVSHISSLFSYIFRQRPLAAETSSATSNYFSTTSQPLIIATTSPINHYANSISHLSTASIHVTSSASPSTAAAHCLFSLTPPPRPRTAVLFYRRVIPHRRQRASLPGA